jgi:predicted nuclease of predicted toxin-antitoxin system
VTDAAAVNLTKPSRIIWSTHNFHRPWRDGFKRSTGRTRAHIEELGLHRARDGQIFEAARAAAGPVAVITKDDDFPKLLDQHGPPPQVVWLRCGNVTNRELRRIVLEAWPRALELLAAGEALIEIRRRPEPPDEAPSSQGR